jgi:quaternary ammonium compound-resistance protein SugE
VGALGTVLIGIFFYGEAATPLRLLLILGAVACIAGLKLTGGH